MKSSPKFHVLACLIVAGTPFSASAGPPYNVAMNTYLAALARSCPDKPGLRQRPPAALLDDEDHFRRELPKLERARLDDVLPRNSAGRIRVCGEQDGAACDNRAYLKTFARLNLMASFAERVCAQP